MKLKGKKNVVIGEVYVPKPDTKIYVYIQGVRRFMNVPYKFKIDYKYIIDLINLKKNKND